MYDEQQRFVNLLAGELSTFIQSVIFPEKCWMTSPNQLIFDGIYLKLSLLTKNPRVQQNNSDYGLSVIDKKHSVSVNLPYLGSSETAFLGFFGLERCLTLHPTQNNKICSIFDIQNRKLLPDELSLKLLLNLFALAVSMTGFTEIPIFVFGTQQNVSYGQNIIITTLGRCQGHIMRGAFFSGHSRPVSDGIFKLQQPLWVFSKKTESQTQMEQNQLGNQEDIESDISDLILRTYQKFDKNHVLHQNISQITLQPIPVIAKYYLETNAQHSQLQSQQSKLQNQSQFDSKDLHNYLKSLTGSKSTIDSTQYLNQDIATNVYINFSDVQSKTIKPSIYNVSQQFYNFPCGNQLFQSQRSEITNNNTSIAQCWQYFDTIDEIAHSIGSAVESMCFHFMASFNLSEKTRLSIHQQISSQYQKSNNNFVQYSLNKYFSTPNDNEESIFSLIKQVNNESTDQKMVKQFHQLFQLYEILDEQYIGQTQNQFLTSFPTALAMDILFSVNFSTAPKGSFDDYEIDIHQSMLWAYNVAIEQENIYNKKTINVKRLSQLSKIAYRVLEFSAGKAPVTTGEKDMDQVFLFKTGPHYQNYFNFDEQLTSRLTAALQFEKQILRPSKFSYFMLHNVNDRVVFSTQQNSNSQDKIAGIMRHCPPNCILCRLGMIFSQTTMVHAIQIASGFQSDLTNYMNLKQHLSNSRYFDVINHSIIIQKLVQIDCCQYATELLESNKWEYVPGTMDQTQLLYDQYNDKGIQVIYNTRIYIYLQLFYIQFKEQANENTQSDNVSSIVNFIRYIQKMNLGSDKYIKYIGKTGNNVTDILNKIEHDQQRCIIYPYDDRFTVGLINNMLGNQQKQQLLSHEELKNSLKINYEKTIKSNIQFIKDGIDPRYLVMVCLVSYLQNKYIQLQKYILYLIQQEDYEKNSIENGLYYNLQIDNARQNDPSLIYGHVISPQAEYYRLSMRPYYISVDCINEHNMESFFYHIYYNEDVMTNTKLISCYFKTSSKIAYEIIHNLAIVEGNDREHIYNQIRQQLRPLRWELVLNCIRHGKINNEPHKLYSQFGTFNLRNDMIIPSFEHFLAFGSLETTQYRQFK